MNKQHPIAGRRGPVFLEQRDTSAKGMRSFQGIPPGKFVPPQFNKKGTPR
jgi:hypothetical protein